MKKEVSGTTWLDLLPRELELIGEDELIDPGDPMGRDEELIGEMTLNQKKLYTLLEKMSKELDELTVQAKYAPYKEKENYVSKLHEIKDKVDVIKEIFYISLKDHFGIWKQIPKWQEDGVIGIGVRADFKVVTIKGRGYSRFFERFF